VSPPVGFAERDQDNPPKMIVSHLIFFKYP
jgi:hypothetical protein